MNRMSWPGHGIDAAGPAVIHFGSSENHGRGHMFSGRVVAAALVSAAGVVAVPAVASAAAQPPGNDNWITLQGTCGGQPATLLDPKGGNTAFLVGGSVGIGKIFTFIDIESGEVIEQTVTGRGIDPDRLITCEFEFGDVRFVVQALVTPQR